MKCLLQCPLCHELELTEDEEIAFRSQVCFDCAPPLVQKLKETMEAYEEI